MAWVSGRLAAFLVSVKTGLPQIFGLGARRGSIDGISADLGYPRITRDAECAQRTSKAPLHQDLGPKVGALVSQCDTRRRARHREVMRAPSSSVVLHYIRQMML